MRWLPLIIICAISLPAQAQETQITVLGVTLPGADYDRAKDFLADVADTVYWDGSHAGVVNDIGVTVRLANFGVPVPMPAGADSTGSGFLDDQFDTAKEDALEFGLRKDADIIIYFTGESTNALQCGFAPARHWTSPNPPGERWQPGPDGLDLNGRETYFSAIVVTGGLICQDFTDTAIHEVGHLLGAGHEEPPAPLGFYIFQNSHAAYFNMFGVQARSIVSDDTTRPFLPWWSMPYPHNIWQIVTPGGSVQGANRVAAQTTGESVAHYRISAEPPLPPPPNPPPEPLPAGCSLQVPINPVAVQTGVCNPFPNTTYNFYWDDMCPGASASYVVEDQQPAGTGPWQTTDTTIHRGLALFINGDPGLLRVRACNATTCSAPSSSVLIEDEC